MQIEPATIEDLPAITELWIELAQSQREYASHLLADENRTAIRVQLASSIHADNILAASTTDIVGFVMFNLEEGALAVDVTRGLIQNIHVTPPHRNQGIGSALMDAAEDTLRERGAEVIGLEVMAANEQARKFYTDRGYEMHRIQYEQSVENDTHSNPHHE